MGDTTKDTKNKKDTTGIGIALQKVKQLFNKNKKAFIIVCSSVCIVVIVVAVVAVVLNQHDYKIVDLSEMAISEACNVAKSHGWKVDEPIKPNSSWSRGSIPARDIDCDNSVAKVYSYKYREGTHTVSIEYNARVDVSGMTVNEGINLLRNTGWKEESVKLYRCTTKSCSTESPLTIGSDSYDENEQIFKVSFLERQVHVILQTDKEDEPKSTSSSTQSTTSDSSSSSSQSSDNSSSSSSSASSSSSDLCKSDYQKNLDAAKVAYDTAQKAYDTYKNLGVDQSTLDTYKSSLDLAKTSLDAAQKIYDTYCK